MASIAGLGFIVWGHHMFASGMNPALGMTFMVSTILIALPSAVKVFSNLFLGRRMSRNPWQGASLEWEAPSPPGHGNFDRPLTVRRGPYEYGVPQSEEDWMPQVGEVGAESSPTA
ncbi:MAG: hypothetical protein CMJ84_17855 [Planctomycetes bacterium]|jgi:heme/copper-type cytochrome/quinol oxidase subunit 1|nr:hypothetical protein [Planctomycetota bacterium]